MKRRREPIIYLAGPSQENKYRGERATAVFMIFSAPGEVRFLFILLILSLRYACNDLRWLYARPRKSTAAFLHQVDHRIQMSAFNLFASA